MQQRGEVRSRLLAALQLIVHFTSERTLAWLGWPPGGPPQADWRPRRATERPPAAVGLILSRLRARGDSPPPDKLGLQSAP